MIADLATCEWSPGSNRSTVDPIAAVFRLELPAPVRGALIAKMRRHKFDDVVTITRDGITSDSGAEQYAATIANMNFSTGRLCRSVTRTRWSAAQRESAIVYIVGEYAIGYAATCGNLFVLTRRPAEPPAQPEAVALEPGGYAPMSAPVAPAEAAELVTFARVSAEPWSPPAINWSPIPCLPPIVVPEPPIPAVPEPSTWAMLCAGLALTLRSVRRRAVR